MAIESPGDGLPSYQLDNMIGKVAQRAIHEDEDVTSDDLKDSE